MGLQDYEVLQSIGQGSFAQVKKVRRLKDNKILAWKELDYSRMSDREKQQLVDEVNIIQTLNQTHIVKYVDKIVDQQNRKIYIVMEYCDGGDLSIFLKNLKKQGKHLDECNIWQILQELSDAIKYVHDKKILHRDIKPANIFIDKNNTVKLGDFGLSKTLSDQSTYATTSVGTPYYMSPEQVNENNYNEKSDIWSLGCLLYELCNLSPPFNAKNQLSLALKIKSGKIQKIPSMYSEELWRVIQWCLTVQPRHRPKIDEIMGIPNVYILKRESRFNENQKKLKEYDSKFGDTIKKEKQYEDKILQETQRQLKLKEKEEYQRQKIIELTKQLKEQQQKVEELNIQQESFNKYSQNSTKYSSQQSNLINMISSKSSQIQQNSYMKHCLSQQQTDTDEDKNITSQKENKLTIEKDTIKPHYKKVYKTISHQKTKTETELENEVSRLQNQKQIYKKFQELQSRSKNKVMGTNNNYNVIADRIKNSYKQNMENRCNISSSKIKTINYGYILSNVSDRSKEQNKQQSYRLNERDFKQNLKNTKHSKIINNKSLIANNKSLNDNKNIINTKIMNKLKQRTNSITNRSDLVNRIDNNSWKEAYKQRIQQQNFCK